MLFSKAVSPRKAKLTNIYTNAMMGLKRNFWKNNHCENNAMDKMYKLQ